MKEFARLYARLDETMRTTEKVDAMVEYFRAADPADAAWAVYFLSGERPRRLVPVRRLSAWAMDIAGVPDWLFDECYESVGDLAETVALLLPDADTATDRPLHRWVEEALLPLARLDEPAQRERVMDAWRTLSGMERYVWNKLITGSFRVGVSRQLVARALAQASGVAEPVIAHRLTGHWRPDAASFTALVAAGDADAHVSQPYPFYLAYALESELEALGDAREWQAEWKWDGIRAQVIRRGDEVFIWSRGEDLVTERFPEIAATARFLPAGTVLDGEIMPWRDGAPLPFAQLQRRIGRRTVGAKLLAEVPVVLVAYDVLEHDGKDIRSMPLENRRALLDALVAGTGRGAVITSPVIPLGTWDDARSAHARSRDMRAEGLMIKARHGPYGVGRRKGGWWKWKVDPYSVDAVLIYAQAGHGRRASLHTDYTFAVWDEGALVPFAKAYSGLTDAELRTLDAWIRRNTIAKYGPVRHLTPEHVFELGFEGIQLSPRHKSGIAVRFPRILRWRADKRPEDADTLQALRALMGSP